MMHQLRTKHKHNDPNHDIKQQFTRSCKSMCVGTPHASHQLADADTHVESDIANKRLPELLTGRSQEQLRSQMTQQGRGFSLSRQMR